MMKALDNLFPREAIFLAWGRASYWSIFTWESENTLVSPGRRLI